MSLASALRLPRLPSSARATSKEWDAYVGQFLDSYFAAHPDVAIIAGRHEFDGKLPDWSAEGIRKEIQRLHSERDRATAFSEKCPGRPAAFRT